LTQLLMQINCIAISTSPNVFAVLQCVHVGDCYFYSKRWGNT